MARLPHIARAALGYFPLTWGGIIAVAAGLTTHYWIGQDRADYVAFGGGLLLAGVAGLAAAMSILASLRLFWDVRSRPRATPVDETHGRSNDTLSLTNLETGAPRRTGFSVPLLRWWPFVEVNVAWQAPDVTLELEPNGVGGRASERITPTRRGRYSEVIRTFTVSDIFGLSAITFRQRYKAALVVSPAQGRYSLSLAMRQTDGEGFSHPDGSAVGERADMRRYAAGDPSRFILWKAYARTRRLLVRAPERAIAPQPSTVAFLIAGRGDGAAAATARKFIEEGMLGDAAVFAADGATSPADSDHEALDQIVDSAGHQDRGGAGLAGLLAQVGRTQLSNCVIFAPSQPGPWEEHLVAFNRHLSGAATVIIGVDAPPSDLTSLASNLSPSHKGGGPSGGQAGSERASGWKRWLWAPPALDPVWRELPGLVSRLQGHGMEVRIVHRGTGQLLDPSLIQGTRGRSQTSAPAASGRAA